MKFTYKRLWVEINSQTEPMQEAICCLELNEVAISTAGDICCTENDDCDDLIDGTKFNSFEEMKESILHYGDILTEESILNLSSYGLKDWISWKEFEEPGKYSE